MSKKTIKALIRKPLFIINGVSFLLAIIWLFYAPGFEPLITSLTLLAVLIGQTYIKAKKESVDDNENIDLNKTCTQNYATEKTPKQIKDVRSNTIKPLNKTTTRNWSGISLDEFLKVLNDSSKTDLQKQLFLQKHKGKIVQWQGIVSSISKMWEHRDDSDLILLFVSEKDKDKDTFPTLASAIFNSNHSDDLLMLSKGDFVEIEGVIKTEEINDTPSLSNCKIITYRKA